jgi:hypothetical protein
MPYHMSDAKIVVKPFTPSPAVYVELGSAFL